MIILLLALAQIDPILDEVWKEKGVAPAARSSDAEFLRRVTLDLTGVIPTEDEVRAFLEKPDRAKKIDGLLASPRYAIFMGETFATSLYGYQAAFETMREPLEYWLRQQFEKNAPYDATVRALLTASGPNGGGGPVHFIGRFYPQTGAPEDLAAKVSRSFLGIRLNCARCHDHPFEKWSQEDFYQLAAFFKGTDRKYITQGAIEIVDDVERAKARWKPRDYEKAVKPRFLSGAEPQTAALREELALFVAANRQFARAFANRLWYPFFGRGIVHPIDNFGKKNPPSVPKLLEWLTDEAIRLKFDVKALIRTIVTSRAYQLTSVRESADPERGRVFAHQAVRALTPEQTADSMLRALQLEEAVGGAKAGSIRAKFLQFLVRNMLDQDLTSVFEYRESVQDIMTKMTIELREVRGKFLAEKPSVERVYLAVLSRRPSAGERAACDKFLKRGTMEEVFITLLNSHEFAFNH